MVERVARAAGRDRCRSAAAIERFEAHYAQTVGTGARPFEGVTKGLERLHQAGLGACGRHQQTALSSREQLLEHAKIARFFTVVIAGDDGVRKKPHGDMLEAACRGMATPPHETLMIGDSDNDVAAARAAGCRCGALPYGYNEGRPAESLACDRLVATVDEAHTTDHAGGLTRMQPYFTVGHSTRPLAEFIDLLEPNGVARVIDVRSFPRSAHQSAVQRGIAARRARKPRHRL
jgi:HAD superfamily hydrolase (TIGR01509 family)